MYRYQIAQEFKLCSKSNVHCMRECELLCNAMHTTCIGMYVCMHVFTVCTGIVKKKHLPADNNAQKLYMQFHILETGMNTL